LSVSSQKKMDNNMYKLRCNAFVLKRKMTDDMVQMETKCKEECIQLENQIAQIKFKKPKTAIDDFVKVSEHKAYIRFLCKKRKRVQNEPFAWNRKCAQLIPDHVASLAILTNNHRLRPKKELFTKDAHRCYRCSRLFLFDSMTHLNHCEVCKIVTRALFVVEDKQTEIISF
jgi:hypothetical protein